MQSSASLRSNRAWTGFVRSLQPVAGARANARDAVLEGRRRAEQRREAWAATSAAAGPPTLPDVDRRLRG